MIMISWSAEIPTRKEALSPDCALEGEHANVVVDVEAVVLLVKADVGHGERLLKDLKMYQMLWTSFWFPNNWIMFHFVYWAGG